MDDRLCHAALSAELAALLVATYEFAIVYAPGLMDFVLGSRAGEVLRVRYCSCRDCVRVRSCGCRDCVCVSMKNRHHGRDVSVRLKDRHHGRYVSVRLKDRHHGRDVSVRLKDRHHGRDVTSASKPRVPLMRDGRRRRLAVGELYVWEVAVWELEVGEKASTTSTAKS